MYSVIKEFVLPPGSLWLIFAAAFALLCLRRRGAGLAVLGAGLLAFYLLSTPAVASRLGMLAQTVPPLPDAQARTSPAEAIVVLSGGLSRYSPEYGGATVDAVTLQRVRYAARLHRLTTLPVLVSGGRLRGTETTLAAVMKQTLADDFGITDVLVEDRSVDTYENAVFSQTILAAKDIRTVLLVTHASHMPRAVRVFADTGLVVIPAPTVFANAMPTSATSYIPRFSGLKESHYAIYELLGQLWYTLRH